MSEVEELASKNIKNFLQLEKQVVLIDVRTEGEWNNIGMPDGEGLNVPTYFLSYQLGEHRILNENFEQEFLDLQIDKSKKILCICRSGARSLHAAEIFSNHGYTAINISDGFEGSSVINEPGWKKIGLPCK